MIYLIIATTIWLVFILIKNKDVTYISRSFILGIGCLLISHDKINKMIVNIDKKTFIFIIILMSLFLIAQLQLIKEKRDTK